jgi:hypothetical protein
MRIVTTTDFYGSYWPTPTSWGHLPGAQGLVEAVARQRQEDPDTAWIDTGDFAQGGPLAPATSGKGGFAAAAGFGIDAATIGNHELDWGLEHLREHGGALPFPLLAANADLGFPGCAMLNAGRRVLGVIGITHPDLPAMHSWFRSPQPDAIQLIPGLAAQLRRDGADAIVVAMHDGIDYTFTGGGIRTTPQRLSHVLAPLHGHVDAVLGGHTLARAVGRIGGVPYIQPWAFGTEIGVIEWHGGDVTARAEPVHAAGPWKYDDAGWFETIVGHVPRRLACAPRTDISLCMRLADAWRRQAGTDVALCFPQELQSCQPPVDGTIAELRAGPVRLADIMRLLPWTDGHEYGQLVHAEMSQPELDRLAHPTASAAGDMALAPAIWGPPAISARRDLPAVAAVAFAAQWAPRLEPILGRPLTVTQTGQSLRDALLDDLSTTRGHA